MKDSRFSGRKILITGASGFIGSHLRHKLCQYDVEIYGLSRVKRVDSKKTKWWQGDLTDASTVASLLRDTRPDYIFNLASYVTGSRHMSVVIPTIRSNLMGQVYLMMEACRIGCKRFVSAGSMEDTSLNNARNVTISPYAAAKRVAGVYGEMFHALYSLPYVHLRVFMVFGPGQKDVGKLIPYSILSMLQGKAPDLSSGRRKIDWIYIEDVVDGILAAALTPDLEGAKLDIGSGKSLPISSIE